MKKQQRTVRMLIWAAFLVLLFSYASARAESMELLELTPEELAVSEAGQSAVFGIAVMKKSRDVSLSWMGNYTSVLAEGTYKGQEPELAVAYPSAPSGLQVIEAWRVLNVKNNTDMTLTTRLNALPTLGEGESLAFYTLENGTLSDRPVMTDLAVSSLATIHLKFKSSDGIALVRVLADPAELPKDDSVLWANQDIYLTGKLPGKGIVEATPVTVEVEGQIVLAAYDVRIYVNENQQKKGKTWQPSDKKVQVHFYNEDFRDDQELNVYHLADGNSQPEKVATVTAEDNWVTFDAESFSVYAFTVAEKIVEAGGKTYQITVTYDAASGIPADARVEAAEIGSGSEYKDYLTRAAQTLGVDVSSVVYSRLFDISLVGPDGTEYQPNDTVSVSIQLLEAGAENVEQVRVVHFADAPVLQSTQSLRGAKGLQSVQSVPTLPTVEGSVLPAATEGTTVSFETSGFSVFSLIDTTVKEGQVSATLEAGNSDSITLSGQMPPEGMLEATPVETVIDGADSLMAYDMKIYASDTMKEIGIAWQPSEEAVQVTFQSPELTADWVNVYHIKDDSSEPELVSQGQMVVDGSITFDAFSFSVYGIVEAPEPVPESGWNVVSTVSEIAELGSQGFYIGNSKGYFFKDSTYSPSNGRTGIEKTASSPGNPFDAEGAVKYYFEQVENTENQFRVYCPNGETKKYLRQSGDSLLLTEGLQADTNTATSAFTIAPFANADNTFYVMGRNNYCWNMQGGNGGGGYCTYNSTTDQNAKIQFLYYATQEKDPYGLDGKTYGIAYNDDSATAYAMTTDSSRNALQGLDLLIRPNVLTNDGSLLVAPGSDIVEWTFENSAENKYYLTTMVGGEKKYLTINQGYITLENGATANSLITATPGRDANSGKWHFTVGGYSLNLNGTTFNSAAGSGKTTWMNLVEKAQELGDDDFTSYTARRASVSDSSVVYDKDVTVEQEGQETVERRQSEVVIYTRVWNGSKYEFYAVDHNGTLMRVYESGDLIQWIGSKVSTAVWTFTEYHEADGRPNYYYELQNKQYGNYIAPQITGGQIMSSNTLGLNLPGRRDGQDYTKLVAWDDTNYAYVGLKVEDGHLVSCPLEEADDFYFAVFDEVSGEAGGNSLTTVKTVSNNTFGIKMRMINYGAIGDTRAAVQKSFFQNPDPAANDTNGDNDRGGLLSTNLGEDGYPTGTAITSANGTSLGTLYSGARTVNNLFIESIYNESGYLEYDSTQNFAHLNDDGHFTVYDQIAAIGNNGSATRTHGQFMPYNTITAGNYATVTNQTSVTQQPLPDVDPRKGEPLLLIPENQADYFFGMEMSATFTQTANGKDDWGHDIIFEFSGDDDFWLYVDGELVLDLGGVHKAMSGSVNFATGVITNARGWNKAVDGEPTLRNLFAKNYKARNPGWTQAELDAFLGKYFNEGSSIFKTYTTHQMKIFYMERGAGASNLHMRFNLASVKPGTVLLTKELSGAASKSNDLAEFAFQVRYLLQEYDESRQKRYADAAKTQPITSEQILVPSNADSISVNYVNTILPVTFLPSFTTADGITYENVFILKAGETAEIVFPDDTLQYAIVECGVNKDVYDRVLVNGENADAGKLLSISTDTKYHDPAEQHVIDTAAVPGENRLDYGIPYAEVNSRQTISYDNHVTPEALRTLSIKKVLYDLDGLTLLHYPANSTLFSFRLYLGSENADPNDLPLANMFDYFVRDASGNYCVWNTAAQKFVSLGKTALSALTEEEKHAATFTTSMNGAISKIPADFTVEVCDLIATTHFKVEERSWEIPRGYTLRTGDGYTRTDTGHERTTGDTPITGTIENAVDPKIEVRNQKGWGLTAKKSWADKDFMREHGDIYLAVYVKTGSDPDEYTLYTYAEDSASSGETESSTVGAPAIRQVGTNDTEVYFFFPDLQFNSTAYPFSAFTIREVDLENPVVEDGVVTSYDSITPKAEGERLTVPGKDYFSDAAQDFEYTVRYTVGESTGHNENVRIDTVTNTRPGIVLKKTAWDGATFLEGARFALRDSAGQDVALSPYTSDSDGLITIAYLPAGAYTLTEIGAPQGYVGLTSPMTIVVGENNAITSISGVDPAYYTQTNGAGIDMNAIVTVKNKPYAPQFKKTIGTAAGAGLDGVRFALYDQVESASGPRRDYLPLEGFEDMTTTGGGYLPQLTAGYADGTLRTGVYYYLHEIEPLEGYLPLTSDVLFTITEAGQMVLDASSPAGVTLDVSGDNALTYLLSVPNSSFATAKLTVQKTVEKPAGQDLEKITHFNFTARLYLPDGLTPWPYTNDSFADGAVSFSLAHEESRELEIPVGAVVTVTEDASTGYTTSYTLNSGAPVSASTCKVTVSADAALNFINTRRTVNVTVTKKVVGNGGTFDFTAELLDNGVASVGYMMNASRNILTADETEDIGSGRATFTLSPDKNKSVSVTLTVPYGATLTVEETEHPNYTTTIGTTETRTWTAGNITSNKSVTFTNTEKEDVVVAPTGFASSATPFLWMLACGLLLALPLILRRKEKA